MHGGLGSSALAFAERVAKVVETVGGPVVSELVLVAAMVRVHVHVHVRIHGKGGRRGWCRRGVVIFGERVAKVVETVGGAARVIVRPFASSLGCTCHSWAIRHAVGFCTSLLGGTCHRWALSVVVGPYATSLDPAPHCWALHLVVGGIVRHASSCGPSATLLGPPSCRTPALGSSCGRVVGNVLPGRCGARYAGGGRHVGKKGGQWVIGK